MITPQSKQQPRLMRWGWPLLGAHLMWGMHMVSMMSGAVAQIIPDTTLAPSSQLSDQNSSVNTSATVGGSSAILIEGGATRSDSLFHSFQDFNVQVGERVYFADPAGIETIFTRVTGNNASNILGTLGVDGTADLFLLNSNGVIFGETAQLDIDGSLVVTTAESIDFGNGDSFSAVNPSTVPLLTVSTPLGLQYGADPGEIRVEGSGSQIVVDLNTELLDTRFRQDGLIIPAGHSLALLGGNIIVNGGNLTSTGGTVELAAISTGYLPLSSTTEEFLSFQSDAGVPSIDLPSGTELGDLVVTGAGSIDASGDPSGNVNMLANNIDFSSGSVILLETLGSADGGSLQAIAPGSITIQGLEYTGAPFPPNPPTSAAENYSPFVTSTWTTVAPAGSTGDGADVAINTDNFTISGGGILLTETNGDGDAGNVTINAKDISIGELDLTSNLSVFGSYVGVNAAGNGGDINITTERLSLIDGSITGVQTRGSGDAGVLNITATESVIIDSQLPEFAFFPALTSLVTAAAPILDIFGGSSPPTGNAGDINIDTPNLQVLNGSQLSSSNSGTGDGGDINITADTVEVDGTGDGFGGVISFSPLEFAIRETPSFISAEVSDPGTGNAGAIRIDTDELKVSNGAYISNSTFGDGAGGDVIVTARDTIELAGTGTDETLISGIYSRAVVGDGSGGDISLTAPQILIQDTATIDVSNFDRLSGAPSGTGPAGNINLEADSIQVLNMATLNADTLSGQEGNIVVLADTLTLDDASQISSSAAGDGSGGNLKITADSLRLLNDSQFVANAIGSGDAGNIVVSAPEILYLNDSEITASGGQGNLNFTSPVILLRDGSLFATDARGTAVGGNILIDTDFLIALENSDITANAEESFGGQIVVNALSLLGTDYRLQLTPESDITASSELGPDLQGNVELNTLEVDLAQGLSVLTADFEGDGAVAKSCAASSVTNSLVTSGRGGVGADPAQPLQGTNIWTDLRQQPSEPENNKELESAPSAETFNPATSELSVVEAQEILVTDGRVNLVTSGTTAESFHDSFCH
ncbi:MAG: S-layer family protein [Cyanobacteria bacterium P01_D01_bin.156]